MATFSKHGSWIALLGVVLLEAAGAVFGRLLLNSPALGLLTGALAGTVTLLLWVYTATAITLLGAEFSAVLDGRRSEPEAVEGREGHPPATGS